MCWRKRGEVLFGQVAKSHGRSQTPAVLRMRWMFEVFLKMHKRARRLNQSLEKIIVRRVGVEPEMLKDIVRFVVTLLVPASKISAIKWMIRDLAGKIGVVAFELAHELRNSFAFVHEAFNFTMPLMMGKPTFPEGTANFRCHDQE